MSEIILIIAEKPSVAGTIASWLAKTQSLTSRKVGTHYEVGNYRVSWLFGHVLENVEPHYYDPKYKSWNADDLPIVPAKWILEPKKDKKTGKADSGVINQINALKALLAQSSKVIGAGDPDQEGQLLQDEFLRWAGCKVPVMRLWLAATDDASVAKAWTSMKPNSEYHGYYWSALARSHADWLAGINFSRACSIASRNNGGDLTISVGRVQTPTLALVVKRELEIRNFKPVDYYTPWISLKTAPAFKASWAPPKDDDRLDSEGRLLDKAIASRIEAACKAAAAAVVKDVKATKGKENPPLPFSLSSLQLHMSKVKGMGVQDVLKYAQSLYEKKIATYPRTDSEYLPESQHGEAGDILRAIEAMGLRELGTAPEKSDAKLKSRAFDDKKVTAHHAIVPRPATLAQLTELSSYEKVVWVEITKRYLLQFFPTAEFLTTEILLECANEAFKASGKVYTKRGWRDAFAKEATADEADGADDGNLPAVKKGDSLSLTGAGLDATRTKAPKRYTEGTLVAEMKGIHKHVTEPKLKASLKESTGIGTEATRANTIGELFSRGFMVRDKTEIKPTNVGEDLFLILPKMLTAPDMTAIWQQAMDDIQKTEEQGYKSFIAAQAQWLQQFIGEVPKWFEGKALQGKGGAKKTSTAELTKIACLKCGKPLRRIKGKFGYFFGCSDDTCKATFKDVGGKPVEKAQDLGKITIAGVNSGDACPKCKKGTMQARVCGPTSKTPGRQFLSCSKSLEKGKAKCDHVIWPPR